MSKRRKHCKGSPAAHRGPICEREGCRHQASTFVRVRFEQRPASEDMGVWSCPACLPALVAVLDSAFGDVKPT